MHKAVGKRWRTVINIYQLNLDLSLRAELAPAVLVGGLYEELVGGARLSVERDEGADPAVVGIDHEEIREGGGLRGEGVDDLRVVVLIYV